MSLRVSPNAGDDARLLSSWRNNMLSAVIQAAWGLILRCYMDSGDVCFGYQFIAGGEEAATREVSPNAMELTTVRLVIGDGDFASTIVEKAKGATVAGTPTINEGRNVLGDGYQLYNTVVLIRSCMGSLQGAAVPSLPSALALTLPEQVCIINPRYLTYIWLTSWEKCLLRLHVKVLQGNVRIFLEWRNDGMSMEHVKGIAVLFQNLLTRVLSPEDIPVADFNYFTEPDWQRISAWNGPSPQAHDRCIHDIIREQVVRRPLDEAICAWDGSLSFKEFDHQASKLAYHLQKQGVGPEVLVPLCFDKSVRVSWPRGIYLDTNDSASRCGTS